MRDVIAILALFVLAGCSVSGELETEDARTALVTMIERQHPGDTMLALESIRSSPISVLDDGWLFIGPARCHLQSKRFVIALGGGAWFQDHSGHFVETNGKWSAVVEDSRFGDSLPESMRKPSQRMDHDKQ